MVYGMKECPFQTHTMAKKHRGFGGKLKVQSFD